MINVIAVVKVAANMHFVNLIKRIYRYIWTKMLEKTNVFACSCRYFVDVSNKRKFGVKDKSKMLMLRYSFDLDAVEEKWG